ncbi:MAG TPA: hypothetical protein VJZ71_00465 [Phycisphaerae bacterium]|nr:hypothetical protein [Phycisphaerae bacterium]
MTNSEWRIASDGNDDAHSLFRYSLFAIRNYPCLALLAILPFLLNCQAMYFLTTTETKTVQAEYAKIGHRKVAVVVWADRSTLDADPRARRRVCDAVLYDLKKHLLDAQFVKAQEIEDFQESSGLDWEGMTQLETCKELKCDMVLRIDLLDYTTRSRAAHELRRGRVRGTVSLYEAESGEQAVYSTDVTASYPPADKQASTDETDAELIREAVTQFGQEVGKKFHDHEESLRGRK